MPTRLTAAIAVVVTTFATAATAHAQQIEIQMFEPGWLASTGVHLGVDVGERAVLLTGLGFGLWDSRIQSDPVAASRSWQVSVPLELKVHLAALEPGRVVPVIRIGVSYERRGSRWESVSQDDSGVGGIAMGGVHYFFDDHVGLLGEAGFRATYLRTQAGDTAVHRNAALTWRAGFVLRL